MCLLKLSKGLFLKCLLFDLMILLGFNQSWGYDFVADGIYYNILSTIDLTCEVTYQGVESKNFYSGNIIIPSEVTYKGKSLSVTGIGDYAFTRNDNLTSVIIPNSVKFIGRSAFYNLQGLKSLTIPSSVTIIYQDALANCKNLTSISFEDGEDRLVLYPSYNGSKEVSPFAFVGTATSRMSNIYIGRNIDRIPKSTFDDLVNLKTLEIGKYVKGIGYDEMIKVCFYNCTKLININIYCANPPKLYNYSYTNFFSNGVYTNATVRVPKGTLDRYKNDKDWGRFWDIEEGNWESPIILSLALSNFELIFNKGDKTKIDAIIEPVSLNKNVSWTSSNPTVATVDGNGWVKAISDGEAIVTCVTTDGSNLSAKCKIIVNEESGIDTIVPDHSSDIWVFDLYGTLIFKGALKDLSLPKGIYIIREGNMNYKRLIE